MTKWMLVVGVLAVLTAAFAGGWYVRGLRADVVAAKTTAGHQAAMADSATAATANDRSNERTASAIEAQRVRRRARREVIFGQLQKEVTDYAHDQLENGGAMGARSVVGCGDPVTAHVDALGHADARFMRIWRAANAGQFTPAEHFDTAGADAAGKAVAATGRQR